MSAHTSLAKELFEQGYNCSQSVLAAFCDETGLDLETALKVSAYFGGGMGRLREVCGAVSGMFMVVGLKYGYTDPLDKAYKEEYNKLIQTLAAKFQTENGSIICRDLLGLAKNNGNPLPEQKLGTDEQKQFCAELVACAVRILDEFLANKNKEEKGMLKIAVASENEMVTEHFGHCANFMLYDTENGKIIKEAAIPNPGHKPGFLPNFLADYGVNVIISGGMGGGAVDIFNERNVEVVIGASGEAKNAALHYLKGELKSTGSVCHEHQHHDECAQN